MPYKISRKQNKWSVINKETGQTKGTHTTYKKALKQMRLLYHIESGKKLTGKPSTLK